MKTFGAIVTSALSGLVDNTSLLPYQGDWVPEDHRDRLRQYELFRALAENRFGALLKDREAAKKLREYGDYALIVETSRDAVLGDRVAIEVPGSGDAANAGAKARQELLNLWADRERWASKIFRGETDAAAVGDCVYELRPDGTRLRLRAHDPESFFPVWENSEGDFSEAYLAWEEMNNGQYLDVPASNLKDLRDRDGEVVLYRRHYRLVTVDEAREAGIRVLTGGDRTVVCVVSAGWYQLETKGGARAATGWDGLKLLGAELATDGLPIVNSDTGFDQVPLFYIPNREDNRQPWGLPEGDSVLHVLLDLRQDHSDLKLTTYLHAFPPLYDENPSVTTGAPRPGMAQHPAEQKYQPGQIYNGRKLAAVDLSKGNDLLLKHEEFLLDKALRNSRTSHILAGVSDATQLPSGYAMMIAMIPTLAKTVAKRTTRRDKLGMLLKYALRWLRDWGEPADFDLEAWPTGAFDELTAYPSFGSIVPIDRKQVSEIVRDLLAAGAISDETAVAMLIAAGFPIDDAGEEVKRLKEAAAPPVGAPGSGLGNEGIVIPGIDDGEGAA
ncbi:MAG: hypothetical protein KY464_17115 [Gemmatimonadetes bacterium]|nr:hypothetical protein [Gemmatimonadota bacterium]